jgi:catechol 2,3-dioxygenase-like lactoylglutathione lyase family enzyme
MIGEASDPLQRTEAAKHISGEPRRIHVSDEFRASRDVIIRTTNFHAATRFYESVLGLRAAHRSESLVGFEAGAFRLYVEEGPEHGPVFDFLVPDLQAAKAALLSAGCTVLDENPSVPRCYIRDPYGLVFNIEQRPPLLA